MAVVTYPDVTGILDSESSSAGLLAGVSFDAIDVQQTSATVETYVYKSGGISGTTVKTIVVTYTDATKENIDTVVAT
jgi:hypothetical protein